MRNDNRPANRGMTSQAQHAAWHERDLSDSVGGSCVLRIANIMTTHRIADDPLPTMSTAPNV